MVVIVQHRRDTAANWTSTDTVLALGEWGYETDTNLYKIGDGSTVWTSLAYTPAVHVDHATLTNLDYANTAHTGFTPIASPTFTGLVTTPTIAVTSGAAVGQLIVSDGSGNLGFLSGGNATMVLVGATGAVPVWTSGTGTGVPVKSISPTFTGVPLSPTAAVGVNTTQIATCAFVQANSPNRNAIINGGFAVAQRGISFDSTTTPANNDDTYLLDRWILLSDGNDIVDVTQDSSALITDPLYAIRFDVETANKKFGMVHILDNKDSRRLATPVSLSFKAKRTGTSNTLVRAAVLSWYSPADVVTSDLVSGWAVQTSSPTYISGWTLESIITSGTFTVTTSWATYTIPNVAIDTTSATNTAVFIWSNHISSTVGNLLYVADVQLERGAVSTPFEVRSYGTELELCQRYCYGVTTTVAAENIAFGVAASDTVAYPHIVLPVEMRSTPTLTATAADWQLDNTADAPTDVTALVIDDLTFSNNKMITLKASTAASGVVLNTPYYLVGDGTTGRKLILSSEL